MASRNVKSTTVKISPTGLLKHELNKDSKAGHAKVCKGKLPGLHPYTESYTQIKDAECGRTSLFEGREHKLIVQYQKHNNKFL